MKVKIRTELNTSFISGRKYTRNLGKPKVSLGMLKMIRGLGETGGSLLQGKTETWISILEKSERRVEKAYK